MKFFDEGLRLYEQQQTQEAAGYFRNGMELGDPNSGYNLARIMRHSENYAEARDTLFKTFELTKSEKAAEPDQVRGAIYDTLGMMAFRGQGFEKDISLSASYFSIGKAYGSQGASQKLDDILNGITDPTDKYRLLSNIQTVELKDGTYTTINLFFLSGVKHKSAEHTQTEVENDNDSKAEQSSVSTKSDQDNIVARMMGLSIFQQGQRAPDERTNSQASSMSSEPSPSQAEAENDSQSSQFSKAF